MKRIIGSSLVWLGNGRIGLARLAILTVIILGWYMYYGFGWVQGTLSPFNNWNLIATLIVLAPGVGARIGGQKLLDIANRSGVRA